MNSNQDTHENLSENKEQLNEKLEMGNEESIHEFTNDTISSSVNKEDLRFAGFWMRFWAYLLDLVVIGSLNRIILHPIFQALDFPVYEGNIFSPISITTAIMFYAYFVLLTKWRSQTIGKMVFGLKVIDLNNEKLSWGTIIFREWIGRFISSTIFILYIVVAFTPKKQGIHDLFADTSVIHER
ncbi:RDD family protein [Bacillus sp. 03113]|uniref:RDD family protein n=1 Tax=Bacillus sp. 03113 TaxID=2578211 RepID=UPI001141B07A|nr:RDD family protein [Bacillus sp. 03113]